MNTAAVPGMTCTLEQGRALVLKLCEGTLAVLEGKALTVAVDVPGVGPRTYDAKQAAWLAATLFEMVKAADRQEQDARRAAGYSPVSEVAQAVYDAKGELVGMRKSFRY